IPRHPVPHSHQRSLARFSRLSARDRFSCPSSGRQKRSKPVHKCIRRGRSMNTHPSYTLASRSDTGRYLRNWNVLTRGTLTSTFLAADISVIVGMSCLTGILYHLSVYGEVGEIPSYFRVGLMVAAMFVISNVLRDEYKIDKLLAFRPHIGRALHV